MAVFSSILNEIQNSAPVQWILGALGALLLNWIRLLIFTGKRLAWRVYMDSDLKLRNSQQKLVEAVSVLAHGLTITGEDTDAAEPPVTVSDPWLVVIRVRNASWVTINQEDIVPRKSFEGHKALPGFYFPGRTVRYVEVMDEGQAAMKAVMRPPSLPESGPRDEEHAPAGRTRGPLGWVLAALNLRHPQPVPEPDLPRDRIWLDQPDPGHPLVLPRRARAKIMVVLDGVPEPKKDPDLGWWGRRKPQAVLFNGFIEVGKPTREGPRTGLLPLRPILYAGVPLVLIGALVGQLLTAPPAPVSSAALPSYCATGQLELLGSTAFLDPGPSAPASEATKLIQSYESRCPGASISVDKASTGSLDGLRKLRKGGSPSDYVAMSDGPEPGGFSGVTGSPVALMIFTLVVNSGITAPSLTPQQVQSIYQGKTTTWQSIDGQDTSVSVTTRMATSGTRDAFDAEILGGHPETTWQSGNPCARQEPRPAPQITCAATTDNMLSDISGSSGAIGYAQTADVNDYPGGNGSLRTVEINNLSGDLDVLGHGPGKYPFWTAEYAYTYGAAAGLAKGFVSFLHSPDAITVLQGGSYTPCGLNPQAAKLCPQATS